MLKMEAIEEALKIIDRIPTKVYASADLYEPLIQACHKSQISVKPGPMMMEGTAYFMNDKDEVVATIKDGVARILDVPQSTKFRDIKMGFETIMNLDYPNPIMPNTKINPTRI